MLSWVSPGCSCLLPHVRLVFFGHSSFGLRTFQSGLKLLLYNTQACRTTLTFSASKDDAFFFPSQIKKTRKSTDRMVACLVVLWLIW